VDYPVLMGVAQRPGRLTRNPQGVADRELALPPEPVAQALALDVGHGEPEPARSFPRVMHGQDVGMLQAGGEPDLPLEPLRPQRGGELRVQHLERHGPVVLTIVRQEDGCHPSPAQLALEHVTLAQALLELRAQVSHQMVPSTSFRKRGLLRSGSKLGSMRSQAGER
jgi:hypothetical protein